MTQFPQLVVNILLTGLASDQLLSSSVHCSREFLMPKHHLSSNPRKQRVPQRARHTGSILWKEPKNGDYTGDSNDSCGRSVRPFGRGRQDTRPPPTDATLPWEGGRARGRGPWCDSCGRARIFSLNPTVPCRLRNPRTFSLPDPPRRSSL